MKELQKTLDRLWPGWRIESVLGQGAFGKVYQISRYDRLGHRFTSALKIISIPSSPDELKEIMSKGMDEMSAAAYYQSAVEEMMDEIVMMSRLKGNTNIVSYEDHAILKAENTIRWDIFIRMELLTPLTSYIRKNPYHVRDVVKLGIDICNGLELCQRYNIIHRDIKPQNIFISDSGSYKIGDFGIARQLEHTKSAQSQKGTPSYMAPEVYKGDSYDATVDVYSLGMVLYELLNENRKPFFPPYPDPILYADTEKAHIMRMKGEKFPVPKYGLGQLGQGILKACAYDPSQRYRSAADFCRALTEIMNDKEFEDDFFQGSILPELEKTETEPTAENEITILDTEEKTAILADIGEEDHTVLMTDDMTPPYPAGSFRSMFVRDDLAEEYQFESVTAIPPGKPESPVSQPHPGPSKRIYMIISLAAAAIIIIMGFATYFTIRRGEKDKKTDTSGLVAEATTGYDFDTEADEDLTTESETEEETVPGKSDAYNAAYRNLKYCKNGVIEEYKDHAYAVIKFKDRNDDYNCDTFGELESWCEEMGGHLAIINDQDENDFIYNTLMEVAGLKEKTAMIGLTNEIDEGDWMWVDGTHLKGGTKSEYWSKIGNQPNGKKDHNVVVFFKESKKGKWADTKFGTATYHCICEWGDEEVRYGE